MPGEHARLSPSSLFRVLNCPASQLAGEDIPEKESEAMREGTEAHSHAQKDANEIFGLEPVETEDLGFFNEEMEIAASGYAAYVKDLATVLETEGSRVIAMTEQRLSLSKWVPDCFGTADCILLAGSTACIIDFKYGRGHLVEVERNPQLMAYGLGLIQTFGDLLDLESIKLCIYQPRRENISEWTITVPELLSWGEEVLRPTALKALNGTGEFLEGDWCWTCKARYRCAARADANLELARLGFKEAALLNDAEMEEVLDRADRIADWAADIKEYAFQQALGGKIWKNWKLVEGRSNRRWKDESGAASVLQNEGIDPYDHKLVGITELEKTLGKRRFSQLLSPFVEKPKGKPTLVPLSDKRKPITI